MKFNKYRIIIFIVLLMLGNVLTAFAENQIPVIVSVSPQYGQTDVSTDSMIRITFNTRMDKKAVSKSFNIYPEIRGKAVWDNNTFVFTPNDPLLASTSYFVTFTPDVKSKDGVPLAVTYFSTPAQGVCIGPNGNINLISINGNVKELKVKGFHPVWALDNTLIIYDYQGQLWKIDTNGQTNENLVEKDPIYDASFAEANPLTDLIAFIGTNDAGCANIYTVDLKSKIVRQLTSFFEPTKIKYLNWSADGLYLAFLRAGQIWIMNQDGKDLRKLTSDDLGCKGNFAWSPGGTKIAFSGENNIWVGDIYSLEIKKLSFDNPKTGMLDWSVNNKIAFESEGITVMNADGSEEIQIPTAAKRPEWINEGKIFSLVLPLYNQDNTAQLWIMSSDGKTKEKIAVIADEFTNISWSKNVGFWNLFSP
ncbi:MAG: Ig-like domain-containing protein [Candidatus Omnitrophica bacterium]|nr:Ig-like domain-containing protein [Candidatus Omnitrophota bacterium]